MKTMILYRQAGGLHLNKRIESPGPDVTSRYTYPLSRNVLLIGRTAFYRYFPTDRIRQLRAEHSESTQT